MDVDKQDEMDDRQHPSTDLHMLSPLDMSRTMSGCFFRWKPSWQTCSQTADFFPYSMTCLKPSADVENEAKKSLHLLKIRKKRYQKWKQKMASGIHQRAVQSLLNSLCFFIATCSRTRAAFKKTLSTAGRQSCLQTKVASWNALNRKTVIRKKLESTSINVLFASRRYFCSSELINPFLKTQDPNQRNIIFIHWKGWKGNK